MAEASNGKDTMTGHWEMMGIKTEKPFKTFTEHGFPPELIAELEKQCGKTVSYTHLDVYKRQGYGSALAVFIIIESMLVVFILRKIFSERKECKES